MDAPAPGPLALARPGERWVVRHRLADGSATDVIGWVVRVEAGTVAIETTPDAPPATVALPNVIAARRALAAAGGPDPRRVSAADLERIALPGWLADHESQGEWTLRSAGGFTGRANSCLAVGDPGVGYPEAAARIQAYADAHGIAPWAQVVVGSEQEQGLLALGWTPAYVSTAVLVTRLADLLGQTLPDADVVVAEELTPPWLAAYDASRPNDADPAVLARILDGRPPRAFASAADPAGVLAIGRGHLERGWLGIASIWTRPDRRRRGWGRRIVLALGHWAARRGARYGYLQVAEENVTAVGAYERMGFVRHHGYRYLEAPANTLRVGHNPD